MSKSKISQYTTYYAEEGDHYSQSILGKIQIRFHLSPNFVEWTSPGEVKRKRFFTYKRFLGPWKLDEATSNKSICQYHNFGVIVKSEVLIIYRRRRTWLHRPCCSGCQHDNRRFYHFDDKTFRWSILATYDACVILSFTLFLVFWRIN